MDVKKVGTAILQDTATVLATIGVEHFLKLGLQVFNNNDVADHALNKFEIWGKVHLDGADFLIASVATDYTAPPATSPVLKASGDLTTLAKNTVGWVLLDVSMFRQITVKAAGSGGTSHVDLYGIAKHNALTM